MIYRFKIETKDRIGITLDIVKKIYNLNLSINSMDVMSEKIYIKVDEMDLKKIENLKENLLNINGVKSVFDVNILPKEKEEKKLLGVIDAVDQGIMAINNDLEIEVFNSSCEKIFNYKKEELLGESVDKLLPHNAPIKDLINGAKDYDNKEFKLVNKRNISHYISSGRSIKDDLGNIIGAVASVKDLNKVKELVDIVSVKEEHILDVIVGKSQPIKQIKELIKMVSKSSSTIMIRGESGTGKELFAKAIHNLSNRSKNNFIPINCAAIPETLMESELFGYEKGSFTGALNEGKKGLFEKANKGTLFLDEIGELSLMMQAKLLRALQENKIRRIGSSNEIELDVRIICATNKNLEAMIENKEFREDLYYRINVIPVNIPPLRDRKEDIILICKTFVDKFNKKLNKNVKYFDDDFFENLFSYNWPGNVRELENIIERAMNLCHFDTLKKEHIILNSNFIDAKKIIISKDESLKESVQEYEKNLIKDKIKENKSIRQMAREFKISHTALIKKIKKYNLETK